MSVGSESGGVYLLHQVRGPGIGGEGMGDEGRESRGGGRRGERKERGEGRGRKGKRERRRRWERREGGGREKEERKGREVNINKTVIINAEVASFLRVYLLQEYLYIRLLL